MSASTARRWRTKAGFPCPEDGPYDVAAIVAWVREMRSTSANRSDVTPSKPLEKPLTRERAEADLEFRKVKTERAALELAKERGDLLTREEIEAERAELLADLRRNLLVVLPRRCAPKDKRMQAKIKAEVRDFLEAFSS